jgi:hypothetical protein
MLYKVKTTSGYGFLIRGVSSAKMTVATAELCFKLYNGRNINLNGVTEFEIVEDESPWMNSVEMVPPTGGAPAEADSNPEGYEFPREAEVPRELATTTFAPLEKLVAEHKREFRKNVIDAVRDGKRRGMLHA